MRKIAFLGASDKRLLVYPLARALNFSGNVAVITDDAAYSRLLRGTVADGTVDRVDIITTRVFNEGLLKQLPEFGVSHDYVLIVSNHVIPTNLDYLVYCRGVDRSICPIEETAEIELIEHNEIILTANPLSKEEAKKPNIVYGGALLKYVYECEEMKSLLPLTDKATLKTLSTYLSAASAIEATKLAEQFARKDVIDDK